MKKQFIHQIIIDSYGFYVFERGLGFYHNFDKVTRVQLQPKHKDATFYTICIWSLLISIALYIVWKCNFFICLLLFISSLFVIFHYYKNRYVLKVYETDDKHYYKMKRKSDPLEVKINEINHRISKERFLKNIERTSKE
jgi:hypothetical protein